MLNHNPNKVTGNRARYESPLRRSLRNAKEKKVEPRTLTIYFRKGSTTTKAEFDFAKNDLRPMQLVHDDDGIEFVNFYRGVKISSSALREMEHHFSIEFKEIIFTRMRTMHLLYNSSCGAHATPYADRQPMFRP